MLEPHDLGRLFFDNVSDLGEFTSVDSAELPDAYTSLLAHHDHMTVTLEAWYNSLVDVHVLKEIGDEQTYARASLLKLQRTGDAVQLGVMRVRLAQLSDVVRKDVQARELPLGRILIRHHVLREVELLQLWRVNPGPELRVYLELGENEETYARTARIMVESKPAVELLEIVKT